MGFEGKCVAHNFATKTVQVFLANATGNVMLPEDQVTRIEPDWKKSTLWGNKVNQLSRQLKQDMLERAGLLGKTFEESEGLDEVEVLTNATTGILDQTVSFAHNLIRWLYKDEVNETWFLEIGFIEPVLVHRFFHPENESEHEKIRTLLLKHCSYKHLIIPIWAAQHWSLLTLEMGNQTVQSVDYYDTLTNECLSNRVKAAALLNFLAGQEVELPPRRNVVRQAVGSNLCGFYIAAYIECFYALRRNEGPASKGSIHLLRINWKQRLITITKQLHVERDKRIKEQKKEDEKEKKDAQTMRQKMEAKAAKALKNFAIASEDEKVAHQYWHEGRKLRVDDLSPEIQAKIQKIRDEGNLRICGSCRYQSGCLRCDVAKAERYWLRKETEKRGLPVAAAS